MVLQNLAMLLIVFLLVFQWFSKYFIIFFIPKPKRVEHGFGKDFNIDKILYWLGRGFTELFCHINSCSAGISSFYPLQESLVGKEL